MAKKKAGDAAADEASPVELTAAQIEEMKAQSPARLQRQELYAAYDAQRQQESDDDEELHGSMKIMADVMRAEAAGQPIPGVDRELEPGEFNPRNIPADQYELQEAAPEGRTKPLDDPEPGREDWVEIKVDGVPLQLPATEVERLGGVAKAQKHLAADRRLYDAAMMERESQRRKAAIDERDREIAEKERVFAIKDAALKELERNLRPQVVSGTAQRTELPAQGAAEIEKLVKHLYSGDEAKVRDAFTQLLQKPQGDVPAVVRAEIERALAQQDVDRLKAAKLIDEKADIRAANQVMRDAYSDINGDPVLREAARGLFDAERRKPENAGKSMVELVSKAAQAVRSIQGGNPGARKLADIRAQKSKLPAPVRTAGRVTAPVDEDESPSPSSIVDQIRKARGQHAL